MNIEEPAYVRLAEQYAALKAENEMLKTECENHKRKVRTLTAENGEQGCRLREARQGLLQLERGINAKVTEEMAALAVRVGQRERDLLGAITALKEMLAEAERRALDAQRECDMLRRQLTKVEGRE